MTEGIVAAAADGLQLVQREGVLQIRGVTAAALRRLRRAMARATHACSNISLTVSDVTAEAAAGEQSAMGKNKRMAAQQSELQREAVPMLKVVHCA